MATGKPTDQKLKGEILDKIRNHGVAVATVAEATGVSTKTIYRWLRVGIVDKDRNLILENNRLRKENEQLYKLLGRATAEAHRAKS
jgi:predicted site-specific integrase-resolvase